MGDIAEQHFLPSPPRESRLAPVNIRLYYMDFGRASDVAAPVPKTNELFTDLASLSATDDFLLRRVENEAANLMRIDASGGHAVLGAAAAIRGNLDRSVKHHELSVRLEDDVALWLNYCTSLARLDAGAKCLEVARRALERHPGEQDLLNVAIGSALQSAEFRDGRGYCDQWFERFHHRHSADIAMSKLLRATKQGLFSDDGVRGVVDLAREVRQAHGIQRNPRIEIMEPDSDETFLWSVHVSASPEAAAQLNEALAVQLAARDDLLADPGLALVVMFDGVT